MPKGSWGKKGKDANNFKHGMYRSPEYKAWHQMIMRCNNPSNQAYKNYGGRGITVCEEFRDFMKFFEHVGPRPSSEYSLERINNSKGYELGNVTWETRVVQNNNNRNCLIVDFLGNAMSIAAAVRAAGNVVTYDRAHSRITRSGWPTYEAVTIPTSKSSKKPKIDLGFPLG